MENESQNLAIEISFRNTVYNLEDVPLSIPIQDLIVEVSNLVHLSPTSVKLILNGKILASGGNLSDYVKQEIGNKDKNKNKSVRILVTGSSEEEIERVKTEKVDSTVLPFKRPRSIYSKSAHASEPIQSRSPYGFGRIEVMKELPNWKQAETILMKLSQEPGIQKIMDKHHYQVGVLKEMYPEGKVGVDPVCVLGYNSNKGESITLRLRTDDMRGFRNYERIREVLFHELAHNVHSEHDQHFYELMRTLEREANASDWTRSKGNTLSQHTIKHFSNENLFDPDDDMDYEENEHRLGGENKNFKEPEALRNVLADAIESRIKSSIGQESSKGLQRNQKQEQIEKEEEKELEKKKQKQKELKEKELEELKLKEMELKEKELERELKEKELKEIERQEKEKLKINEVQDQKQNDSPIESLKLMGFSEELAKIALKMSHNNLQTAIDLLLSGKVSEKDVANIDMEIDTSSPLNEKNQQITNSIQKLFQQNPHEDAKRSLEAILTYISNALSNPQNEKYRKIRNTNEFFQSRIGNKNEAIEVLQACGFYLNDDYWILKRNDPGLLWLGKSLIETNLTHFV